MVSPPPDGAAPLKAPISDVDPFSSDFFENPFAAHEELREAGPVVRLSRYGVWAAAGYQEVHASSTQRDAFAPGGFGAATMRRATRAS